MAIFRATGKQPSCRDVFTIAVKNSNMISKHSRRRKVGIGSSDDDFTGAAMTIRRTSSVVTSRQDVKTGREESTHDVIPAGALGGTS